ncbi:hypothetical protein MANES_10G129101v8 [Manihot esculenta]|uniref:Uncharacterized protein n=1 Tax=Manihot esculenta TaxID=3983 RepID=A0ACB7H2A3_MANES|nr:hypothetical protein MANES_10G129101v8 [Manihot esculenta]
MTGSNIPVIVRKYKIKWLESFKNTTTEIVVKNWIIKRAQFPTVSYANKLTLQEQPSFGAQKAQCQALLAVAKTPEEYKMICQQIFNHLGSGESVKNEKLKQEEIKSSNKDSSRKALSRRKNKKTVQFRIEVDNVIQYVILQ